MNTLRLRYIILFLLFAWVYLNTSPDLYAQMEVDVGGTDTAYIANSGDMGYYSLNSLATGFRAQNTGQAGFISGDAGGTGFMAFDPSQRGYFVGNSGSHGFHSLTAGTYGFFADNSIEAGFLCDNSNGYSFLSMDSDNSAFRSERAGNVGFVAINASSSGFFSSGSGSYGYFNLGSEIDGFYSVNSGDSGFRSAESIGSGFSATGSGVHGMSILNSIIDGVNIQGSGSNGVTIINSESDGVQSIGSKARAGFFTNDESSINPAMYIGHGDNSKFDLQLNRTGRIAAEISMVLYLGTNGGGGQLIIVNDDDETVATVSQNGNAEFTGSVTKGGGTFKIDHPLEPTEKYLYHSFVESPDMMNIYNGNIETDQEGYAEVTLPSYFEALNKEFRYQLTSIGTFGQVIIKEEIKNGRFIIQSETPKTKVSWQVTGIRKDNYAEANRVQVEVDKEPEAIGTYLHPEVWINHSKTKPSNVGTVFDN